MEALDNAIAWQTAEPIRVNSPGLCGNGAVLHGFDKRSGPLGLYTEITGYAVSLFTFLLCHARHDRYRQMAIEAADYLLSIQADTGAYPDLPDPLTRDAPRSAYSFDVAMCIVGLARLSRLCPERGYLSSAMAAARWLIEMQRPDGSFLAMKLESGALRDPGGFFGDGSCIHAKNAIALLELHAANGQDQHRQAAVMVCEHTLTLQASDGAFWSRPDAHYVFAHAHAYACEGLLFAGAALGEERFTNAAHRGIEWLAANQRKDGGWLSYYKTRSVSRRRIVDAILLPRHSDAAAQAARLFCFMGSRYDAHRRKAFAFLLGCQDASGGFHYRRTRLGYSPFLNTWSAQFAVQALMWDSTRARVEDLF